jgi:hypothetical protein
MAQRSVEALPLTERRRRRARLYRLLAALHAGPLGIEIVPQVRRFWSELSDAALPDIAPSPPADLYRWAYGHCRGSSELGCTVGSPSDCLPAKFLHLADSARRGARQRRLREADFIDRELSPCLTMLHGQMEVEAYRDVMAFSRALVEADAARIRAAPDRT